MKLDRLRNVFTVWLITTAVAPAAVRYVDVNNANSTPPYLTWASAATNIQDALDAADAGDQILVTNGVYQAGGRLRARVRVEKPVRVQSVKGPHFTLIEGGGTGRCVSVQISGISVSGFTLTNGGFAGPTGPSGAGVFGGTLSNCILTGNAARLGGGAAFSTLTAWVFSNEK